MYSSFMALTIKNPETVSLAREYALSTGMTQTGAITVALRQALDAADTSLGRRTERVEAILQRIWAGNTPEKAARIRQNLDDLYDERGLPT